MQDCTHCGKLINDDKALDAYDRGEQWYVCKTCRVHPRIYYYERPIRAELGMSSRKIGKPYKMAQNQMPFEMRVFDTIKHYLPYHRLYNMHAPDLSKMDKSELIAFYLSLAPGETQPFRSIKWYTVPHDYPKPPT